MTDRCAVCGAWEGMFEGFWLPYDHQYPRGKYRENPLADYPRIWYRPYRNPELGIVQEPGREELFPAEVLTEPICGFCIAETDYEIETLEAKHRKPIWELYGGAEASDSPPCPDTTKATEGRIVHEEERQ